MISEADLGWMAGILDFQGHLVKKNNQMRAAGSVQIKARKKNSGEWYAKGWGCSPVMSVARRFKVPVRVVRDVIEAQR